ncbi:hypothetical protein [Streptomyces sp. NPDC049585]|uniref:hypothetical protein n=1 Tax=Streptomyces sp. NPDC049585 TaxID=3155154 RepID=UPI0034130B59
MEYAAPTAGLIIAAVLFIFGVLSVNDLAARDFKVTVSGKVGPVQRGVLVTAAVIFFVVSVVWFSLLASRPSGDSNPPPAPNQSQSAPAGEMTLNLSTVLPEGGDVVQQTDEITVDGGHKTLSVNTDNPSTNDAITFSGDPGETDYKVEISLVLKDGTSQKISGTGTIFVDNGLSYVVDTQGDPPQAVLRKA